MSQRRESLLNRHNYTPLERETVSQDLHHNISCHRRRRRLASVAGHPRRRHYCRAWHFEVRWIWRPAHSSFTEENKRCVGNQIYFGWLELMADAEEKKQRSKK